VHAFLSFQIPLDNTVDDDVARLDTGLDAAMRAYRQSGRPERDPALGLAVNVQVAIS
jgi:hypothetical protein